MFVHALAGCEASPTRACIMANLRSMHDFDGGHLLGAHVRPTCELILTESPVHLQKRFDPESSLALITF